MLCVLDFEYTCWDNDGKQDIECNLLNFQVSWLDGMGWDGILQSK